MSQARTQVSKTSKYSPRPTHLLLEELEVRTLPSAGLAAVARPASVTFPFPTGGFTPYQIRHAYGFDAIQFTRGTTVFAANGAGQTIAVIDPFDDPEIANDLAAFDSGFGLPAPPSFRKVGQAGGAVPTQTNEGWAAETSLDVEWAHALAPAANILLVEANSDFLTDLFAGVQFAATQVGVSVVSMSFGSGEFQTERSYDVMFTTPRGHQGVTFVASTGDTGSPGEYPAYSPNVLAVGGTSLMLDAAGNYASETGWGSGAGNDGSGGGQSLLEPEPAYQMSVQHSGKRQIPDVAFDADPNTGVPIYDTHGLSGQTGWFQMGGTSLATPAWAALVAISNEGRMLARKGTLLNRQAATALYALPATDFHDIVAGNNESPAGPGYDLVTGRGSPVAARVVAGLVSALPMTAAGPGRDGDRPPAPFPHFDVDDDDSHNPGPGDHGRGQDHSESFRPSMTVRTSVSDQMNDGYHPRGSGEDSSANQRSDAAMTWTWGDFSDEFRLVLAEGDNAAAGVG
jgi:subtilase family serine protease